MPLGCVDEDVVTNGDVSQPPEEGIAMARDYDIADVAGEGSVLQMPRSAAKRLGVGAVQDDRVKRDSRDGEMTDRRALVNDWSRRPRL